MKKLVTLSLLMSVVGCTPDYERRLVCNSHTSDWADMIVHTRGGDFSIRFKDSYYYYSPLDGDVCKIEKRMTR